MKVKNIKYMKNDSEHGNNQEINNDFDQSGFEDDPFTKHCNHLSHNPPGHMVIPYGKIYRHVCPGCKRIVRIRSAQITF